MLAAIILSTALVQERTVTFTHPCAHSSVVLEAFGREIGEVIRPSGSVIKDYFLVRFDDLPVADAKAAIAKTLNATWIRQGEVWYLTRMELQVLVEELMQLHLVLQAFDDVWSVTEERVKNDTDYTVKRLLAEIDPEKAKSDNFHVEDHVLSPYQRLGDRILLTFTLEQLKQMPVGTTYYSTNPNPWESPMPAEWVRYIGLMDEEDGVWRQVNNMIFPEGDYRRRSSAAGRTGGGKTDVGIHRNERGFYISLAISRPGIPIWPVAGAINKTRRKSEWSEFVEGVTEPLKLDGELLEVWKWMTDRPPLTLGITSHSWQVPEPIEEDLVRPPLLERVVKDVVANEPLGLFTSQPFLQTAERKGLNLVALLPDSAMFWYLYPEMSDYSGLRERNVSYRDLDVARMIKSTDRELYYEFDQELDVWIVQPRNPVEAREMRAERDLLSKLLHETDKDGWLRIDACEEFFARSKLPGLDWAWSEVIEAAMKNMNQFATVAMKARPLRFYSLLPPNAKAAARNGEFTWPMSQWPPQVMRMLESLPGESMRMLVEHNPTAWSDSAPQWVGNTLRSILDKGMPEGTSLKFRYYERVEPRALTTDGRMAQSYNIMVSEKSIDGGYGRQQKGLIDWSKLAVELQESVSVSLVIPGEGKYNFVANFSRRPRRSEFVPYDKLPPFAQEEFDKIVKLGEDGA